MATINVVVPRLEERRFSGGIFCVLQYAKGLVSRGHTVNVVPLLPSPRPRWFQGDFGTLPEGTLGSRWGRVWRAGKDVTVSAVSRSQGKRELFARVRQLTASISLVAPALCPHEMQRGLQLLYTQEVLGSHSREADVTLATSYETALPVHLFGTGRKFLFAQHYEPYFSVDMPNPKWAEQEALWSYRLPLHPIANSTWLKRKLEEDGCFAVPELCTNAIDHAVFNGAPHTGPLGQEVKVISYGGRDARWKGFKEMAEAMRIVRQSLPSRRIRWLVYGTSLLPSDNPIAPFEPLGFLQPPALANAYRGCDVLLSASWYESFPLFPLEAMGCGLPIVTTQPGTEDFAVHGVNAEIVEPQNPEGIARGLERLIRDDAYRSAMAVQGREAARRFRWENSVERMERILLGSSG